MNKYILLLGVAGVALGSYCAYAGNSATMTVTATINHDVSLTKVEDMTFDATINPAQENGQIATCELNDDYVIDDGTNTGQIRANIPNYDTSLLAISPAALTEGNLRATDFVIEHDSNDDSYVVCGTLYWTGGAPSAGTHNFGNITITYHP
ncbi:MAG: hypothetical protein IJ529_02800 [Alphaproteobacteria bacterium]|nr:hypothetical protein [Alphaproteobacteria bacterium]